MHRTESGTEEKTANMISGTLWIEKAACVAAKRKNKHINSRDPIFI
jgi:hypothetical protein